MNKLIYFLLLVSFGVFGSLPSYGQSGSKDATAFHSRVSDSTTVVKPAGWGTLYYNGQSSKWRVTQNGLTFDLLPRYGTAKQIPFINSLNTGFSYSTFFQWDNANRNILAAGDGASVTGNNSGTFGRASSNAGTECFNFGEQSSIALGCSDAFVMGWANTVGTSGTYDGCSSLTFGTSNINLGYGSYAGGVGSKVGSQGTNLNSGFAHAFFYNTTPNGKKDPAVPYVYSNDGAGNISRNTSAQTDGNGSLGQDGFILGGYDQHIPSTSPRSIILGGHTIAARASDPDEVYVPNFNIVSTPLNDDALTQVLVRDAVTGQVKYKNASSFSSGGGITNSAALNELMRSNGTNAVSSGLFASGSGNMTLGSSSISGDRSISASSSSPTSALNLTSKGTGYVTLSTGDNTGSLTVLNGFVRMDANGNPNFSRITDTNTNASPTGFRVVHLLSSGSPAIGYGVGIDFGAGGLFNSVGASINAVTTNVSVGTESFDLNFKTMTNGAALGQRLKLNNLGATVTGQYNLSSLNTAPLSATDTGATGEIRWTGSYVYLCIATNTWVRAALSTW